MKTTRQKKQMRIILGILVAIVLILTTVGIVLGIKNCNTDQTPPATSGTDGQTPEYELPMDTF